MTKVALPMATGNHLMMAAPLHRRLTAGLVDAAIATTLLVSGAQLVFLFMPGTGGSRAAAMAFIAGWAIVPLLEPLAEALGVRSVGKWLLRLEVRSADGGKPTTSARWFRFALKATPVLTATAVPLAEIAVEAYPWTAVVQWAMRTLSLAGPRITSYSPTNILFSSAIVYGAGVIPAGILLIGMWPFLRGSRQALHDRMTGTAVFPSRREQEQAGFDPVMPFESHAPSQDVVGVKPVDAG